MNNDIALGDYIDIEEERLEAEELAKAKAIQEDMEEARATGN